MNKADLQSAGNARGRHDHGLFSLQKKWRRVVISGLPMLFLVILAVIGPAIVPRDPFDVQPKIRLSPPGARYPDGGLMVFGTDGTGRDVLSRTIYATRISLPISLGSVAVAAAIGIVLGLVAGYSGGWIDSLVMRLADVQLAFPGILLALMIVAALGTSISSLVIALGLSRWTSYARLVRGNVLSLREREYVVAAKVSGARGSRIMFRHILPNVVSSIYILAALHLGRMIILESALSFLGLGIQPPTPSWGGMVGAARNYLHTAWWAATFPGLAIAVTVLVAGLLGDALRDALDPRFRIY